MCRIWPRWAVLALSLPAPDEAWIGAFARGFFACAEAFGVDVAGGDTTRGPLNLCPTVFGEVPAGQAILRSGARAGDELWVSAGPGRPGSGSSARRNDPRLRAGRVLAGPAPAPAPCRPGARPARAGRSEER